ncbi:MAG: L-aspartate oxidase [Deltaproteobacteria bacterium]|nr:L-aspartate oxidase [Deltaproteobacteria bacterium]
MHYYNCDVLVIGSGIAGLSCAYKLSQSGFKVLVVAKESIRETATHYAQGGIAAATDKNDLSSHIQDTLKAGDGLCDRSVVETILNLAPQVIKELIEIGVHFSQENGKYHLTREGGHSSRRVFHYEDVTGLEIQRALTLHIKLHPSVEIWENHMAIDLIVQNNQCRGAYVLDIKTSEVKTIEAKACVLATGGAGKVYLFTSNPDMATGDGVAMAARRGAIIKNMEFFQFHPTCLYNPKAKSFLISEAVRGEGGQLILSNGSSFMEKYHPLKSLAPRDVVARAIDSEMKASGADCVYLDISRKPASTIKKMFPHLYKKCLEFGFDMTKEPIAVVPAAHYSCGGVATDLRARTSIPGLYAIGEVACTGLHGANRLASNSLMEAAVMADLASVDIVSSCHSELLRQRLSGQVPAKNLKTSCSLGEGIPLWNEDNTQNPLEKVRVSHAWDEIRRLMWNYVGIVRSDKRLELAHERLRIIQDEIQQYYWQYKVTKDSLELRNIATVAALIIESSRQRKENCGLHYNIDNACEY